MKIKQAVVLAAGLGTRLKPYTDTVPKVMLPILGKPMLQWHLEQYKKHGVTEFFFNLHHLPEKIKEYFGDGMKWGVKIHYHFEPVILGTAGGVKSFEKLLDERFYVNWGDTVSLVDYTKTAEIYAKKKNPIGMQRIGRSDNYADVDVAEIDGSVPLTASAGGKIIKVHPKPHTEKYPNAYRLRGSLILEKRILEYVPPNESYEIGKHLIPDVIRRGENFYGYECDDFSKGIDTLEKWKEVEEYLKKNRE